MDEIAQDSIKFKRILLSRNSPVALVVGAAGFFGSHLVDKLLHKGIQVVGIDELSFGKRINLTKASQDKNFHLIVEKTQNLNLELERVDYIFITNPKEIYLHKILEIFKKHRCLLL